MVQLGIDAVKLNHQAGLSARDRMAHMAVTLWMTVLSTSADKTSSVHALLLAAIVHAARLSGRSHEDGES